MTELERSEVRWGRTEIPYVIRRSDRRATVGIAVEPSGTVVLTAPRTASVPGLDRLVREKAKWIIDRVRRRGTLPPPRPREFVSGETFQYLGRQYRLRVLQGESVRPIALRAGWLELSVPSGLEESLQAGYARAALIDWYTGRARERLSSWVERWATAAALAPRKIIVVDQAKRWGSCANEVLRLNWRIVQAPRSLIDYVLAHEVVHLAHEHHGESFWAALGRIMPDYEDRKERLRSIGPELSW
jgi:predicted metal-dependent hydrolase